MSPLDSLNINPFNLQQNIDIKKNIINILVPEAFSSSILKKERPKIWILIFGIAGLLGTRIT